MHPKLQQTLQLGQSIWLDYIDRPLITSGKLEELIEMGLRGMTSNPAIFNKAISASDAYDIQLRALAAASKSTRDIYETLAITDIIAAADLFWPVYQATDGLDGYVSLEADPHLAYDTRGTVDEVLRLHEQVNRQNVMFKVPATVEGAAAIEELIGKGININATLMFSLAHYKAVVNAYMAGLERRVETEQPIDQIAAVASFFISRVDTKVDERLKAAGNDSLRGQIAISNAKIVYQRFRQTLETARWQRLAEAGAQIQRLLWGSTSTKNPAYPDTLYVDRLIGPHTVNTMPLDTLQAFLDHGEVNRMVDEYPAAAQQQLDRLRELGIDLDSITSDLQREGVKKFIQPFEDLHATIEQQHDLMAELI